ncbi:MAG: LysR family transcriptional regulator substrate-binding protein [Pyrinomonadaceae bacterium]|nr:LysR family transcriptional regulator substrate-binding protein [Pyrinomonadaceae bacterium]
MLITEAGEKLLERARRILREHDAAIEELAEIAGAENGRLRIGSASAMFATEQLPGILEKLQKKYKNAEVSVSSGTSKTLVDKILHGEIDVAFVSLPVENTHIQTELLYSDEVVAIAHPSHPLAKEKYISAAALADEKLILGEKGGNTRRMIDDFFDAANVNPHVVMELSRQEAINKMVENNMGVGIAGAKSSLKDVAKGKVVSWWVEGAEIKWNLGLARLRGGYYSPIAEEFSKICRANFEQREKKFKASK